MRALGLATILLTANLAAGCGERADAQTTAESAAEGAPYVLKGTQVWSVPDPVSGRDYEVFVSLPASYEAEPNRRYPVLYVTDADYAFPIIRQIARRVNLDGPVIEEFILVGLSYAVGEGGMSSRTRDYTPVRINDRTGGGMAYQAYLKTQALPFIEDRFRADPRAASCWAIPMADFWARRSCSASRSCSMAIFWAVRPSGSATTP